MDLGLPHWEVVSVEETTDGYRVDAIYTEEPTRCPHCHRQAPMLYRHGKRQQVVKDLPRDGKRVTVVLTRARYRCLECGRTFLQPLYGVPTGRQMTHRLMRYIEEQSTHRTSVSVAHETGVSERTVRNITKVTR